MPGCAVANCKNFSEKTDSTVSYHSFPKDIKLCKSWKFACVRKDKFNTKTVRVCSAHFAPEDFVRDLQAELTGQERRRYLKPGIIPHLNLPHRTQEVSLARGDRLVKRNIKRKIVGEISDYSKRVKKDDSTEYQKDKTYLLDSTTSGHFDHSPPTVSLNTVEFENLQQEVSFLKSKVNALQEELKKKETEEKEIKTKYAQLKQELLSLKIKHKRCPKEAKTQVHKVLETVFTPQQIERLLKQRRTRWKDSDISAAITLRSVSRKAYVYLRKKVGIPLPGLSTLRKWTRNLRCLPGLQKEILSVLQEKSKTMSSLEKLTVLSFDEMNIDSRRCYDEREDQVLGPFRTVQVAMARGLAGKWKQPVYYNYNQSMTKNVLFEIINALEECGFQVIAVVSDMGGGNQSLWKQMNISPESTSFDNPFDVMRKVWVFADVPHLIKLLRNHFLDHGIILPDKSVITKHEVLSVLQDTELKLTPKLSTLHLDVKKSARQKVKYATQLFSHHTAALLKLKYPANPQFSEFFDLVDQFFDVLNSRFLNDYKKPWHSAFGIHIEQQINIVNNMKSVVEKMRVAGKTAMMPFQKGILITISSLLEMHSYLQKTKMLKFIMTSRLNQDVLENLFSRIRNMGHSYDNPTPTDFKYRIRMLVLGNEIPTSGSCAVIAECGKEKPYLTSQMFVSISKNVEVENSATSNNDISTVIEETDNSDKDLAELSTQDNEALRYIAGYVAHFSNDTSLKGSSSSTSEGTIFKNVLSFRYTRAVYLLLFSV